MQNFAIHNVSPDTCQTGPCGKNTGTSFCCSRSEMLHHSLPGNEKKVMI